MTIASIDLGSNTILLLIADYNEVSNQIKTILNQYSAPRVSTGLKDGGLISIEKISELESVLKFYKDIAEKYSCKVIICKATNAFRIASNSMQIISQVLDKLKLNIEIISGDEEARLTFLGTTYPLKENESCTVIDIGGGSTEIICGTNHIFYFKKSFNIGVVGITEKYFINNPPIKTEIKAAEEFISTVTEEITTSISSGMKTFAVAGTPTTLACIKKNIKIFNENIVDNSILTIEDVINISNDLCLLNKKEVLLKYGQVVEGREDVLFAGCLILSRLMMRLKLNEIVVSTKGLRYGSVIDYFTMRDILKSSE
jgi:exopolyphosphatase/guanosine-5'-triphosphate,3'-diphosphate pyrophosphatase